MTDDNLSQENHEELQLLVIEAERAKERAAQNASIYLNKQEKKKQTDEKEYSKRLERSLRKDDTIVVDVKKQRIEQSLKEWGKRVGPRFASASTQNPVIGHRVARMQQNTGLHKTSLVLYGNLGTGKTWSAYAYINMAIAAGYVTAGQIIADTETAVLSKIAVSGYKKPEMLEELTHPRHKIFFIDEVGQGFFNDPQKRHEVWFELIDHVYAHNLTLIMTSNLNFGPQMSNWIGVRAFDRLRALVGEDGLIEPSKVNRRPQVLEQQEQTYRGN